MIVACTQLICTLWKMYLRIGEKLSAHWGQVVCTMCATCLHNVYNSSAHCARLVLHIAYSLSAHCVGLVLHIAYLPSEDTAGRSSGRQSKGVGPSHHNASFPLPIWHRILQTAWSHITHTFWTPAGDKQHACSCTYVGDVNGFWLRHHIPCDCV